MRGRWRVVLIAGAIAWLLAACTSSAEKEAVAQEKEALAQVDRSHKILQGAVQVGVTYVRFGELLQALAGERLVAKEKVTSTQGLTRIEAYARAIDFYRDGMTLWHARIDRDYFDSAVPILKQHGFSTDATGSNYTLGAARKILWAKALRVSENLETFEAEERSRKADPERQKVEREKAVMDEMLGRR
jgi:hypothetical protein